jgi:hypothetical protein
MNKEQNRDEANRRFQIWEDEDVPARKYALLLTGYFRTDDGPYSGQPKYQCLLNDDGRALLELMEASADRPLIATERALAAERTVAAVSWDHSLFANGSMCWFGSGLPECLHLALSNPHEAVGRMIGYRAFPDNIPRPSVWYPSVLRVMGCLCPSIWQPSWGWSPPADALAWARRIYESRNFADLSILADLLENSGCPDRFLLDHCRHYPEHFRGCAALDRLLGR